MDDSISRQYAFDRIKGLYVPIEDVLDTATEILTILPLKAQMGDPVKGQAILYEVEAKYEQPD